MDYQVGSTVEYQAYRELRTVKVVKRYDDLPFYNKPGFDGTLVSDETMLVWGFDDSIVRVIEF